MKKDYRLYVIHILTNLRTLDFNRINEKEREAARKLYKCGEKRKKKVKTFVSGEELSKTPRLTKTDAEAIKKAISHAKSLVEVERLTALLQTGQVPQGSNGLHFETNRMDL